MKAEEIRQLPIGPKLNLLVAVHIEGMTLWEEAHDGRCFIVFQNPGEREPASHIKGVQHRQISVDDYFPGVHYLWGQCNFSTEMALAWPIAERLGIALVPRSNENGKWWYAARPRATSTSEEHAGIYHRKHIHFESVSAPHAICIAALLDHFVPEGWKI